ncbi:hypothetical protein [Brevundimonas sp. TWP2-3-4b1]|uniref:sulfotransferase family protein n=1 Tax=Brevundimonas sp. TWP2-3-4b1 TaxID=2804580 RepID=UPI003CFB5B23
MKEAIVVLGMHRSGTSSVAGAIAKLGAVVPQTLMPDHPDNPKGYWESGPLVDLSDRILASGGSSWSDWRAFNPDWSQSPEGLALTKKLAPAIRAEFNGAPQIVIKDPRMCRIFPIWQAGLKGAGYQARVLTPLRSPNEVAASLHHRDGFTLAHGMMIWLRNVLDAERASRELPRAFVLWRDVLSDWRTHLLAALADVGATPPRRSDLADAEIDAFLDAGLRRQTHDALVGAPDWVEKSWTALLRLRSSPGEPDALADLDEVREELDAATAIFGPVLVGLERDAGGFLAARRELDVLGPDHVRLGHELIGMTANRNDHAGLAHTRLEALNNAEAQLIHAQAELDKLAVARLALDERLTQTLNELVGMTANRDDHARLAAARHVALETLALQSNDLSERLARSEAVRDRLEVVIVARDAASAEALSASEAQLGRLTQALEGMTANRDEHQKIASERQILIDQVKHEAMRLAAQADEQQAAESRKIASLEATLREESDQRQTLADALDQAVVREAHLLEQAAEASRLLSEKEAIIAIALQERQAIEGERKALSQDLNALRQRQMERPVRSSLDLIGDAWTRRAKAS